MTDPPPASDLHLALALTTVYAWPVLREQILDVLAFTPDARENVDARMAELLGRVATGTDAQVVAEENEK